MTQYLTTSCYKKRPPKKILIPASLWSGWRNPSKREGSSRQITTWPGKQTKGDKTTKLWEQDMKNMHFPDTRALFSLRGSCPPWRVPPPPGVLFAASSLRFMELSVDRLFSYSSGNTGFLSSTVSSYASISVSCTISKVFLNFALLLQGS